MAEVILQEGLTSREVNIVRAVAITNDIKIHVSSLENLEQRKVPLITGALPVGSVEFVKKAMKILHIPCPRNYSYYISRNSSHYCRDIETARISDIKRCRGQGFLKPRDIKIFNGFVYNPTGEYDNDHDREQHAIVSSLSDDTPIYICAPVKWVSEVRYYIYRWSILGEGRYDDGPDDAPMPDQRIVNYISMMECPPICALDVGVLDTGETAIVEVNDAWALGFYSGTLSHEDYFMMLWERWQSLLRVNDGKN